jgi:glycosyltransferase involved in cell wall biosynthesis
MLVLHLCTYDQGGAANAALGLHEALLDARVDSLFASKRTTRCGRNRIALAKGAMDWRANLYPRLDYHLARVANPLQKSVVTTGSLRGIGLRALSRFQPDIIHLHWIDHGMLSISDLEILAKSGTPMIWTLHDMAPAAGGFGFRESAGLSPMPFGPITYQDVRRIASESIIHRRATALANANLTIVTPSQWLAQEARLSPVFKHHRIETIPYGVDTAKFHPMLRTHARNKWGIADNKKVILFGADTFDDKRKGLHHLAEALKNQNSQKKSWSVLGFGNRKPYDGEIFPIPVRTLGRIHDPHDLASLYSAADVFACPSREDNLPNTMLESLACGTPVAAFEVGGIPDFIRPGISGTLAPRYDEDALANGLRSILEQDSPSSAFMRGECRRIAVEELSLELQASRYIAIYEDMLNSPHKI